MKNSMKFKCYKNIFQCDVKFQLPDVTLSLMTNLSVDVTTSVNFNFLTNRSEGLIPNCSVVFSLEVEEKFSIENDTGLLYQDGDYLIFDIDVRLSTIEEILLTPIFVNQSQVLKLGFSFLCKISHNR